MGGWELVHDFGDGNWVTVLASGSTPQGLAVYARVRSANGDTMVVRSSDGGKNWKIVTVQ